MNAEEALDRTVDPVARPADYQDLLVGMVGDDDPAEVQAALGAELSSLVRDAGPLLRSRPAPDEWSVLECVGHLVDAEVVSAARYRWIVSQDQPPLYGYDQDLWARTLRHNDADPHLLLAGFAALRQLNLAMWAGSTPQQRARVGIHAERGAESYDLTFRMMAGHGRFHVAQARRTLRALRAEPRPPAE